jgi:hypothetical protein
VCLNRVDCMRLKTAQLDNLRGVMSFVMSYPSVEVVDHRNEFVEVRECFV